MFWFQPVLRSTFFLSKIGRNRGDLATIDNSSCHISNLCKYIYIIYIYIYLFSSVQEQNQPTIVALFLWFLLKHIPHPIRDSQNPISKVYINKNPPKKNADKFQDIFWICYPI